MTKKRLAFICGFIVILIVSMQNCAKKKSDDPVSMPVVTANTLQEILTTDSKFTYYAGLTITSCVSANLAIQPDSDIVVSVTGDNPEVFDISPSEIIFTNSNWMNEQALCISPKNYGSGTVALAAGSMSVQLPVNIINPPLIVSSERTVGWPAGEKSFSVSLSADPGSPASATVFSESSWLTVDKSTLDFDSTNWEGLRLTVNFEKLPESLDRRKGIIRLTYKGFERTVVIDQYRFAP